jgi:penicillin-binding protein 1A
MALGRTDLAGKTGTTNDQQDAWFCGFNGALVTTAWLGHDQVEPLGAGETGGRAALPMWMEYMGYALEGTPPRFPEQPGGLVSVRIDPETGLLPAPGQSSTLFEIFRPDQVPTESRTAVVVVPHGGADGEAPSEEPLF